MLRRGQLWGQQLLLYSTHKRMLTQASLTHFEHQSTESTTETPRPSSQECHYNTDTNTTSIPTKSQHLCLSLRINTLHPHTPSFFSFFFVLFFFTVEGAYNRQIHRVKLYIAQNLWLMCVHLIASQLSLCHVKQKESDLLLSFFYWSQNLWKSCR